jgi:hypothetical protein
MTKRPKDPGKIVDEMIVNPRRLFVSHFCLAILAAFAYWTRAGTFTPHRPGYGDISYIFLTFFVWIPYLISGIYSRQLLAARSQAATILFIATSIVITVIATCMYLDLFGMKSTYPPIIVSIAVTIALLAAAKLCAVLWPSDVSD